MADSNDGRGWHGDPEGHAEASRRRSDTNWWPLLFIPLAFLGGWGISEAMDNGRDQAATREQIGVGGGPETPCVTPGTEFDAGEGL